MPEFEPTLAWLENFARVTRRVVLEYYQVSSCVASTRIGLDVLQYFGVPARPQAVRAFAFTADRYAALLDGTRPDQAPGYSVGTVGDQGVTSGPNGRKWDGHLVLVLPAQKPRPALIDLSADQMSRPQHNMPINGPVVGIVDLQTWAEPGQAAVWRCERDVVLVYEQFDDAGYRQGTNWRKSAERRQVAGEIIRALKGTPDA